MAAGYQPKAWPEHAPEAPFEPEAGGVFDLEDRDWVEGQFLIDIDDVTG